MQDEMLTYYERELTYVRKMANDFALKYPKIANRLLLEHDKCEDPHVERLLQGFAFMAARIHRKLDDEFPEIVESLLNVLYPHYLAPIPSMSIAQFTPDPMQGKLTDGYRVKRHTPLFSKPIGGTPCRFKTCYPVTLWPVEVKDAKFGVPGSVPNWPENAKAVLRLELKTLGDSKFSDLELDQLRFFLNGEDRQVHALHELIFNNVTKLELRTMDKTKEFKSIVLAKECLCPVGYEKDEGLLPYPNQSFLGYRLLQEYFTFPDKFLFFDICELNRAGQSGFENHLEILFFLDEMPANDLSIGKENFLLGCTPIINLFEQIAEPINLDRVRTEYHIIPDLRRQPATEVYSVDKVTSTAPYLDEPHQFQPLYSYSHAFDKDTPPGFWYASRKPSPQKDDAGTDVYISIVNLDFKPTRPADETLTVHTTCTNRDLPAQLSFGDPKGDFELDGAAPITTIKCLKKPTPTVRAPLGGGTQWRLISHLSLNYLSLAEKDDGRKALQEILKLYNYQDSAVTQQKISGIVGLSSERVVRRISSVNGGAVARGMKVTVEFDEEKFVGSGVFLLASVLERFLGLYVSINSFCQLVATTKQRLSAQKGALKQWPARAGEQVLL